MTYNACAVGLVGALCTNNLATEQEPVWSVLGVCLPEYVYIPAAQLHTLVTTPGFAYRS